jgi:hypothetical protein
MSQEEQSKPWEIVPASDREVARRSMDLVSRGLEDLQSSRPVPTPQCQPAELDLSGPWRCRATLNHDQPYVNVLEVSRDGRLLASSGE